MPRDERTALARRPEPSADPGTPVGGVPAAREDASRDESPDLAEGGPWRQADTDEASWEGGGGPPATILVVDDEPMARQVLSDLLESQGFRVVTAERGEQVFGRMTGVDLVLLDGMLPGRDGWDICSEIKQRRGPLFPVIMVTARTAPEDIVRTFSAGADDYLPKPFNVAELTARVKSRIRIHRAEQALQKANRRLSELAEQNYRLYERARRDAEERSLLLRELDHRVRNNLSVITGLVSMERNRRPARPADAALASLENRLRSYLVVHDALRRQTYGGVPLRDVAERLAFRLRGAFDPDRRLDIEVEGSVEDLHERQGFALALILNELLTNALKHAFPEGREGTVRIQLHEEGSEVLVDVLDDGVGAEGTGVERSDRGSGRSIVRALVEGELGGRIEHPPVEVGTLVRIRFPKVPIERREEETAPPSPGGAGAGDGGAAAAGDAVADDAPSVTPMPPRPGAAPDAPGVSEAQ